MSQTYETDGLCVQVRISEEGMCGMLAERMMSSSFVEGACEYTSKCDMYVEERAMSRLDSFLSMMPCEDVYTSVMCAGEKSCPETAEECAFQVCEDICGCDVCQ